MSHKTLLFVAAWIVAVVSVFAAPPCVRLGDQVKDGRPVVRWRGFNLLEMLNRGEGVKNAPRFREEDFQIIREWGFNFVRIPMDYRFWIRDGDRNNWECFDEAGLANVDRAVALGRKYGIHVCLNMHRCPGYTVGRPKESTDLFSDKESLRVCCEHWAMFARRYRGIPNSALSFNLINEPPTGKDEAYVRVVKALVAAIRAEDPDRYIVADGLACATRPANALVGLNGIGQAARGYAPLRVTHYLAPWAGAPSAKPVWPMRPDCPAGILAGPRKTEMRRDFELLDLPPCTLEISFDKASDPLMVRFIADGKRLKDISIAPEADNPMWSSVKRSAGWSTVQGCYLGRETFVFREPVKKFTVRLVQGDWIQIADVTIMSPDSGKRVLLACETSWRAPRDFTQRFTDWNSGFRSATPPAVAPAYAEAGKEYLYRTRIKDWEPMIEDGAYCFVGEFGVWCKTPHHMALALLEDYLSLWKERNIGWALWNLRGGNGVLDSGRDDVQYEDFRGHRLDRKMLELLQRY